MRIAAILSLGIYLVCASALEALAQPDWLKPILARSPIEVDKRSSWVVLHHSQSTLIGADGASSSIRLAIRVLNDDGRAAAAIQEAQYPDRAVRDLKGWLIRSDGSVRKLSGEARLEVGDTGAYYSDRRMLLAGFEEAQIGDVAAFEYVVEEKGRTGSLQHFEIQQQQPVEFAEFRVTPVGGWSLDVRDRNMDDLVMESREGATGIWTARSLPFRPQEPMAPSWAYLSRTIFVVAHGTSGAGDMPGFGNWAEVSQWYEGVSREAAEPDPSITKVTLALTDSIPDLAARIESIGRFVREDVRYVAVEIGPGRWEPRSGSSVLLNRYGDCKDKATLMRAMLKVIDISSSAVLANSTAPVDTALPNSAQFNHCIVGIPARQLPDRAFPGAEPTEGWLFYDPTSPVYPVGMLPKPLLGSWVLPAGTEVDFPVRIASASPEHELRTCRAAATLDADGGVGADVTITFRGCQAADMRYRLRDVSQEDLSYELRTLISTAVKSPRITSVVAGGNPDSTWISFRLESDGYLIQAGDVRLLKPDLFASEPHGELPAGDRKHPIWFGSPREIVNSVAWILPNGWRAESAAPALSNDCGAVRVASLVDFKDSAVTFEQRIRYSGDMLPPGSVSAAREFCRTVAASSVMTLELGVGP